MPTKRITEFLSLVIAQSLFLIACGSTARTEPQNKDGDAIKQVAAGIDAAWNKGDASAFASYWAEDGTIVNPMGESTAGRAEIEKDMTGEFSGSMKGTTHRLTIIQIYWPKPDVAVVDGEAEVAMVSSPNEKAMPPWKANFTAIFVKDKGSKWIVSHMRSYTFVQPPLSNP